jgi:hypothetical protein
MIEVVMGNIIVMIFSFLMVMLFLDWFISKIQKKTKDYREDLTNLYVAGKIKNIASKDDVDLEKETKEFRKFTKLMSSSYKQLDNVVEEEMKESIQKDFEEARHK